MLNNREAAISEAKRAIEMLPISENAAGGPNVAINLAVVYAWTHELVLALEALSPLTKTPNGIYDELKLSSYFRPLRRHPASKHQRQRFAPNPYLLRSWSKQYRLFRMRRRYAVLLHDRYAIIKKPRSRSLKG